MAGPEPINKEDPCEHRSLLPRIDPTGFMRVKMNIALRNKRTLSPVRLVLEDSSKRSFMLFVVVSLQLGSII